MKYFFTIALGLLLASSSVALADDSEPPTGTVALLCKMSRHAQLLTQTLSVDYDKQQVNGVPAIFTASMIAWTVDNGPKREHHELNRITGIYYFWTENETSADPMPTFSCEKAPPKF